MSSTRLAICCFSWIVSLEESLEVLIQAEIKAFPESVKRLGLI